MSTSYADTHDLDKLAGWYRDMVSAVSGQFPVYVLFLVSGEDHRAHNIFRQYRSRFQARNVPYQNLIIFGQHGVSTTVLGLLSELDLLLESLPPNSLVRRSTNDQVTHPFLGSSWVFSQRRSEPWKTILAQIEEAEGVDVDLGSLPYTTEIRLCRMSILDVVQQLSEKLA